MYSGLTAQTRKPQSKAQTWLVGLLEGASTLPRDMLPLNQKLGGVLSDALKRPEQKLSLGQVRILYPATHPGRVILVGLGKKDQADLASLRVAAGLGLAAAYSARCDLLSLAFSRLDQPWTDHEQASAIAEGMVMANLEFDQFHGAARKKDGQAAKPIKLTVEMDADLPAGFKAGLIKGEAANYARLLAATPPNIASPAFFVAEARKLARRAGLKCSIIDAAEAERLGMGGLVNVGRGSRTPPALIVLQYSPSRKTSRAPIMLVGKAVTFDTGGYSLKISGSMAGMKYDKCGGMAVLGAMEAVGRLKPSVPVVGLVPCVENMIGPDAYRVDDIITMHNGVTVEVTNTDAEGRLILADALSYGCEKFKPEAVIDLATLTGGVVVALGDHCAGVFCRDTDLFGRLQVAAERSGEKIWQLPLWDEHRELMKGTHSDLVNSSARKAHPIQGAAFLSYFVGDQAPTQMPTVPWAHIDIAGVASLDKPRHHLQTGPTGYGVRLLLEAIERWPAGSASGASTAAKGGTQPKPRKSKQR